jgi:hypothetical protein
MWFRAQLAAVVGFVTEHLFRWLHSAEKLLGDRAVVRFASGHGRQMERPEKISLGTMRATGVRGLLV